MKSSIHEGEIDMIEKEQIADELAKAAEMMDVCFDTDINSQQRSRRETELRAWKEAQAHEIASEEGIELTDEHMQVVHTLREYYRKNGAVQNGRVLGDMLEKKFAGKGGRQYLRRLFPGGPVTQGMRLAGMPIPAHSEDDGFGTAR
jgi:TusE/DsrC/DsvC family sulfur relay protein